MTAPPIADFSSALARGIALFNERRFFEAHEVWEDRWRLETGGPPQDAERAARALLLHGLIQVAAGFVKWQRGEPRGMVALLRKGQAKLEKLPASRSPVDLPTFVGSVDAWRRHAEETLGAGAPPDRSTESPPRLQARPAGEPAR